MTLMYVIYDVRYPFFWLTLYNVHVFYQVVLMSATIQSQRFAGYFSLYVHGRQPAPILDVEGRCYTVQEYYLESLKPLADVCIEGPKKSFSYFWLRKNRFWSGLVGFLPAHFGDL